MDLIPFDSDQWEIYAEESRIEDYLGRQSLFLKAGHAVVKDSVFTDGIIEYDVATDAERKMIGAVWRLQDLKNYERFYMRPHQSGNPDANQYTPIFNNVSGWQLYYGEGYSAPIEYPFNEWIHVKIVIAGLNAEIYIQNMDEPLIFVNELKHGVIAGKVGLEVEPIPTLPAAHFANFRYVAMDNPPLRGTAKTPEPAPEGTVLFWQVSDAFAENALSGKMRLTADVKYSRSWTELPTEQTGLANLARLAAFGPKQDTVFARITVDSESDQVKPLQIGFANKVRVYLNDRLLFAGNDTAFSRDYRFLGTIGYYDEVYLPLHKGENEVWLAVTEGIPPGGWGVQARFPDMSGIAPR
jgi:hypothetical protein